MQSFLCRVMALVFIFNCVVPAPSVWAQSSAAQQKKISNIIEKGVRESLNSNVDASIEKALEEMFAAQTINEMKDAIIKLHNLMDKKYASEQKKQAREQLQQKPLVHPASSTYVAKPLAPAPKAEKNEVLARLEKNDLPLDELVDYIDPFSPAELNLQNVTYASEILGNTIDAMLMQLDEFTMAQLNAFLPFAQLRTLYRLNKITPTALGSIQKIMAMGSLRIAMWKMHNYYVKTDQQDPLIRPQENRLTADSVSFNREHDQLKMQVQRLENDSFSLPSDIYQQLNAEFLQEIQALKSKNPQEGQAEYQFLLTLVDYAVTYALLVNPQQLVKIVKQFDKGPARSQLTGKTQPGKFLQPYSPVLNAIFVTTFENTKYLTDTDVWPQVIEMLKDFSDPEKYSLPTRIFALEAASLLYSSNSCQAPEGATPQYDVFVRCNTPSPEVEQYRTLFAQRTVDLYAPLTRTHYLAMEDYGLDSKQMKALADKLAYIYNGFANDELKWDSRRAQTQGNGLSTTGADGKSLILNAKGSIPRLLPANQGHMFQLPNGQIWITSGFGRDSNGNWVEMQLSNKLNAKKVNDEYGRQFTEFVGWSVFWIYGGEIFTWLGTAFRSAKGAIVALPKAFRAARTANKGRRGLAAAVEFQKSIRYANLAKNLSKNGVIMTAQRTVTKIKPGQEPETKVITQVLSSKRKLQNKEAFWNPKRWVGLKKPKIESFYFQQANPGFKATQGFLDATNSTLSNGINSWDDWRKLRAAFQSVKNPAEHAYPKFYDYLTRKEVFQEMHLTNAMTESARNGAFDVWLPIKTQSFQPMQSGRTLPAGTDAAPAKAGESFMTEQEIVTWWNASRFGKPGNPLAWDKGAEVYITPRTTQNVLDPAELRNAVKIPFSKVASNEWQPELINHFFKTVDRQGISRYLLPKYVPNANFYSEVAHNWRFGLPAGKAVLSNSRFWKGWPVPGKNGLRGNLLFFTGLAAVDAGIYPFQKDWITSASTQEHAQEQQKYGDAFDPQKLKEDEQAMAAYSKNKITGDAHMSTLENVRASQKEESTGASVLFPILWTRNALIPEGFWGHLPMVSDQDKELYKQAAARVQFNRSQRAQTQTIIEQNKQFQQQQAAFEQEITLAFRTQIKQSWYDQIQNDAAYYDKILAAPENKEYRAQVKNIFQRYSNEVMAVFSTDEDPMLQDQKAVAVQQKYAQELDQKMLEIARMQELLYEQQQQQVEDEEYDFDFDLPSGGYDPSAEGPNSSFAVPADSVGAAY